MKFYWEKVRHFDKDKGIPHKRFFMCGVVYWVVYLLHLFVCLSGRWMRIHPTMHKLKPHVQSEITIGLHNVSLCE